MAAARRIIRAQLEARGWNEKQLAELVGVNQSTISRLMRETTDDVRFSTLQAIANVFGLSVSQIIGEEPIEADSHLRTVRQAMQRMPEYVKDALVDFTKRLVDGTPHDDGPHAAP